MEELQKKLENMSSEEKEKFMDEIKKKALKSCIFCKILRGEIPSRKIFETENIVAFLDINPVNPGHTLVVPKKHYLLLAEIPDNELSELMRVVRDLSSVIFKVINSEGISIIQNNGEAAGQVVPHVHVHIIPRFSGDKFENKWPSIKLEDSQFEEIQRKMISVTSQIKKEEKKIEEKPESTIEEHKEIPKINSRIP